MKAFGEYILMVLFALVVEIYFLLIFCTEKRSTALGVSEIRQKTQRCRENATVLQMVVNRNETEMYAICGSFSIQVAYRTQIGYKNALGAS